MKIAEFVDIVDSGLEPEMQYKGKTYWAAYNGYNTPEKAFYEAYSDNIITFLKAEEILDKEYNGFKIRDMIESLGEDDIDY